MILHHEPSIYSKFASKLTWCPRQNSLECTFQINPGVANSIMSSSPSREPLTGIIRQDAKVVGAICLPDEELQDFIEQFNHCYGPLGMRIEMLPGSQRPLKIPAYIAPVGATFRQPLKPPKS